MPLFNKKYLKDLEAKVKYLEEKCLKWSEAYSIEVRSNNSLRNTVKELKEENAMLAGKCADLTKEKLDLLERMVSMLEKEVTANEADSM